MVIQTSTAARARIVAAACVCLLVLGGCRAPEHEPPGEPPAPQATGLRDAIQDPLDKGQAVEAVVAEAEARRRAQAEDSP